MRVYHIFALTCSLFLFSGCMYGAQTQSLPNDGEKILLSSGLHTPRQVYGASNSSVSSYVGAEYPIGSFSTKFDAGSKERNANIELAARAIDGQVVGNNETFSFNKAVGPTTKANGFKRARIFINGKKSFGYGGGVCQVSSTLYNAVKNAGLEITERHVHSRPVGYVAQGDDAATSYGVIDFKFTNKSGLPVKISGDVEDYEVRVSLTQIQV